MSGLLALLDDVAAIAKVAASSLDDVAAAAGKAGAKAAGVVIDDTAVTPKYVHGFEAKRELPIIGRIALGSMKNKLLILLPAALLLNAFAPWAVTPLLALGGAYLCFEGAEKIFHALFPHGDGAVEKDFDVMDPAHLEEEKVRGAIKTDFILSAEIMTIALAAIPASSVWMQGAALALVGAGITVAVYGAVALIVKMDDVGLFMARRGRLAPTRAFGRGLVMAMPKVMTFLSTVGTAAMLWVGGAIVIHGLEAAGWTWVGHRFHDWAATVGHALPSVEGLAEWGTKATLDGLFGLAFGLFLIPVATRLIGPLIARLSRRA
ncbi:MAG: DUF808 domain-containing protein [Paracoccaceae bacterium]